MKKLKKIEQLGEVLSKKQQQEINGGILIGTPIQECRGPYTPMFCQCENVPPDPCLFCVNCY